MGRIKTQQVKRLSSALMKQNPGVFSEDFDENKKILEEVADIPSKKIRNLVAGAVTSIVKQEE